MTIEPADWLHIVYQGWQFMAVWDPLDTMDVVFTMDEPTPEQILRREIPNCRGHVFCHHVTFDPGEMN